MAPPTASSYSQRVADTDANSPLDYWLYLRSFVRSGLNVASITPSSRWTAHALLRGIEFQPGQTIVELGAGTGAVTASLLKAAEGRCRSIIVEREPSFCERLRQRFPQAEIVAADALELPDILERCGIRAIDHVVSTLPINWIPPADRHRLLQSICRNLKAGGSFRQLTHLPWFHRSLYRRHFHSVECPVLLRNLPPASYYLCHHPRPE